MNDKGEKNGECNRTVCTGKNANYFNHSTLKYYCSSCAELINDANREYSTGRFGHELCTER